jgi:O-antigen/teichoic acid export membrane protein
MRRTHRLVFAAREIICGRCPTQSLDLAGSARLCAHQRMADGLPPVKRRSLFSQTTHTLGSMIGNQGLQIAAGIAISRVYGPPGKGLVTYAGIAILGVIAIADGLSSAIARRCSDDRSEGPAACAAVLRIIVLVSAVTAIPLVLLGGLIPAQRALLFVGIAVPFALYVQTMSGFHLIALRVERTNVASLVINAGAAFAMLLATLFSRPSIDIIMAIWTSGWVAGAAIIYQGLDHTRVDPAKVRSLYASVIRFAIRSSSASLMTFLASRVDVFIVAATLSATALGNYTLALACGELMWQLGRAMSWSAFGRVATAPMAQAAELTAKITRMVLALEVLVAVVAFIGGPAVFTIVYGPAFADSGKVLRILLPGMALYAGDSILSYFIAVKVGRPGFVLRVETATFVVCAVGSLATVGRFGMIGPALATTVAYLVSFSVKSFLFVRTTGVNAGSLLLIGASDLRRVKASADQTGPAAVA